MARYLPKELFGSAEVCIFNGLYVMAAFGKIIVVRRAVIC